MEIQARRIRPQDDLAPGSRLIDNQATAKDCRRRIFITGVGKDSFSRKMIDRHRLIRIGLLHVDKVICRIAGVTLNNGGSRVVPDALPAHFQKLDRSGRFPAPCAAVFQVDIQRGLYAFLCHIISVPRGILAQTDRNGGVRSVIHNIADQRCLIFPGVAIFYVNIESGVCIFKSGDTSAVYRLDCPAAQIYRCTMEQDPLFGAFILLLAHVLQLVAVRFYLHNTVYRDRGRILRDDTRRILCRFRVSEEFENARRILDMHRPAVCRQNTGRRFSVSAVLCRHGKRMNPRQGKIRACPGSRQA